MTTKTINPVPTLTVSQYCVLRSLSLRGIPKEFKQIFLDRCGADETDWQTLTRSGYIIAGSGSDAARYALSPEGRRVYSRRPRNIYF